MKTVIVFGPLFTHAERTWNVALKKAIELESYGELKVTLPQEQDAEFVVDGKLDFDLIVKRCLQNAETFDIAVAILDGPDSDSGTCIEIGYRKGVAKASGKNLPVIGVRTDFRRSEDGGTNAMLRICDAIIDCPSYSMNLEQLAQLIIEKISELSWQTPA